MDFFSARKRREKQQEIKIFKDEQLIETMNNLFFFFWIGWTSMPALRKEEEEEDNDEGEVSRLVTSGHPNQEGQEDGDEGEGKNIGKRPR